MKRCAYKTGLLLFLTLCVAAFEADKVSARENAPSQTDFTIGVSQTLSSEINYTPITFNADGSLHVANLSLIISSNNETGYVTTMTTNFDAAEDGATSLKHDSGAKIPTLASQNIPATSFVMNSWGYSLDSGTSFNPLMARDGVPAIVLSTTSPADSGEKNVQFGFKADQTTVPGDYYSTVLFTTVTNYVPQTLANIKYMQEMTADICANTHSVTVADGDKTPQYKLIDKRDDKVYWVSKLADGKCWMTQNLGITEGASSNVSSDIAFPTSLQPVELPVNKTSHDYTDVDTDLNTIPYYNVPTLNLSIPSGGTIIGDAIYTGTNNPYIYYDNDDVYYDNAVDKNCNYDQETKNPDLTTICDKNFSKQPAESNGSHGRVGAYYGTGVATATDADSLIADSSIVLSSNTTSDSICPRGWTLPTDTEIDDLLNTYASAGNYYAAPLYLVPAGTAEYQNKNTGTTFDPNKVYMSISDVSEKGSLLNHRWIRRFIDARPTEMSRSATLFSKNEISAGASVYGTTLSSIRCVARDKYNSLKYDGNGGTGFENDPRITEFKAEATTLEITDKIPTKANQECSRILGWDCDEYETVSYSEFLGWSTDKDATTPMYSHTNEALQNSITFSGDVTLYAVWGEELPEPKTMQEMSARYCDNMPILDTRSLLDVRSNKQYRITRLDDGECWMTQNLDLDLSTSQVLTSEDTDLNTVSSWTPNATTLTAQPSSSNWSTSVYTSNSSYDPGDYWYYQSDQGTKAANRCSNTLQSNTTCRATFKTTPADDGKSSHVGNYYSYNAATATSDSSSQTGEAPNSICPKGWKLPSKEEWEGIYEYYTPTSIIFDPVALTKTGRITTSLVWGYVDANYWTSTLVDGSDAAYAVYAFKTADAGDIPEWLNFSNLSRYTGNPIRCKVRR